MTTRMKFISLIAFLGLFLSVEANATDIQPGIRTGAYFDAEAAFLGGEVVLPFGENWNLVPNVELVFIDNGTLTTYNFDIQYDFPSRYSVDLWAGAGPAIIHLDPARDDRASDTDLGVNVFFGVGFPIRDLPFEPYIQPKFILSDNSDFALGFGVRFHL